jgi:hypothetical protein
MTKRKVSGRNATGAQVVRPTADGSDQVRAAKVRFWRRVTRGLQCLLAVAVAFAVWSIGFAGGDGPVPVLPDTDTQFSLDLEVVATLDHPVVYVVEQRARPAYRYQAARGRARSRAA